MTNLPLDLQTASLTVDQTIIRAYADLTNDFNPIHLDPEFAAKTSMGGVIAHGTMSVSLIWQALEKTLGGACLPHIELDIRFIKPVRLGDKLLAGGQRQQDDEHTYDIWVREERDGENRIIGTATYLKT